MTEKYWRQLLAGYAIEGNATESRMANILLDLLDNPSNHPLFDRWASRILES